MQLISLQEFFTDKMEQYYSFKIGRDDIKGTILKVDPSAHELESKVQEMIIGKKTKSLGVVVGGSKHKLEITNGKEITFILYYNGKMMMSTKTFDEPAFLRDISENKAKRMIEEGKSYGGQIHDYMGFDISR